MNPAKTQTDQAFRPGGYEGTVNIADEAEVS